MLHASFRLYFNLDEDAGRSVGLWRQIVVGSTRLQYKIELGADGLVDGPVSNDRYKNALTSSLIAESGGET